MAWLCGLTSGGREGHHLLNPPKEKKCREEEKSNEKWRKKPAEELQRHGTEIKGWGKKREEEGTGRL